MSSTLTGVETPGPTDGPVRVLVLSRCTSTFGLSRGGADVLAQRHAIVLARNGFDVVYVGTDPLRDSRIENVVVRTVDLVPPSAAGSLARSFAYVLNEGGHVAQAALAGLKVYRRGRVEVAISNSSIATLLLKALGRSRPVIHYIHDGLHTRGPNPRRHRSLTRYLVNYLLEKAAIRWADQVICASDRIAGQAIDVGANRSKLTVMYPFLWESSTYELGDSSRPPTRLRPAEIEEYGPYLLMVGQQTGRKRFDLVLRALVHLPKLLRLVAVGDGPMHPMYREQADRLGLTDRVTFLSDVSDESRDLLYESCVAYVLVSENEGFPITVAEALSHGRPAALICPSTSGLGAVFVHPFLRLATELSESVVAATVLRAMAAESDSAGARKGVREWARIRFPSEEEIQHEYRRIFTTVLESRPRAPPSVVPQQ
jgi:glycosyltransferase involved in cell wall biosynthesis